MSDIAYMTIYIPLQIDKNCTDCTTILENYTGYLFNYQGYQWHFLKNKFTAFANAMRHDTTIRNVYILAMSIVKCSRNLLKKNHTL